MQIARTIAAEINAADRSGTISRHDNSRRSHQRQTNKWLTRRTEQLHLLAVFAYRALAAQAAICLQRNAGSIALSEASIACISERAVISRVQDLFEEAQEIETADTAAPLATRMRPRSLEEFVGQEHILGPGKLLRRAIEADRLPSVIFHGPPGSGKTTLARVIAEMTHAKFVRISGVESNVAEMRRVLAAATNRLRTSGQKTILFVDEIHHFNKAQQDILLPDVEAGNLRLIGATTYNPFFYVNSALVSRSQVFRLEPLSVEQLEQLIDRALADKERGLGNYNVKMDRNARRHLAKLSDGDARKCLNALEIGVLTTPVCSRASLAADRKSIDAETAPATAIDSLHARSCRGKHPAEGRRLRPRRRRPLRHHQRVHQKHARFG